MELTMRMLELADFPSGARLLDVCCGEGATVEMLLKKGFDARGIDLEPWADVLPLMRGSAYALPCDDGSLDGILCECAFSLLEPDRALDEFARVLKTGGALLLSDVYARAEAGQMGTLRAHTRENLEELLQRHSFKLQFFEDRTDALKSFLAQQIMEYGGGWLCENFGSDASEARRIKCGYCVLAAML